MKHLPHQQLALWNSVGTHLTEDAIKDEIDEIIKHAPPLHKGPASYRISRETVPVNVWIGLRGIEDWGMANVEEEGQGLIVDATLLDLIMAALEILIRLIAPEHVRRKPSKRNRSSNLDGPSWG